MKLIKYTDIKKFPFASYRADISLDYTMDILSKYIYEYGFEMNPEFQRGHVWTPEQQISYMEFRLKGGLSGKDIYFNDPYWQSISPRKGYNRLVCVDGLQRLSAAMSFLLGEIPVFGSYVHEYEQGLIMSGLHQMFTFHIAKLKSHKEVMEWYVSLNQGGTPHRQEEIEKVKLMIDSDSY
jgi:hypothetical protein